MARPRQRAYARSTVPDPLENDNSVAQKLVQKYYDRGLVNYLRNYSDNNYQLTEAYFPGGEFIAITMLCAISGVQPEDPVASKIDGNVFSKRLILSYLENNGNISPVTGAPLHPEDLVDLTSTRIVTPRPPTLTSVPSLLAAFQNEWDALAMESFTLRQQLAQTRQELSTALYDFEGALRVIDRVSRERDEARSALSRVSVGSGMNGSGEDGMMVDAAPLSDDAVEKIESTHAKLSSTRRKRPVPGSWATPEQISALSPTAQPAASIPGARALAIDAEGDFALFGGSNGAAIVYSLSQQKVVQQLACGAGTVTAATWWASRPVVALSTGEVKIFEDDGTEFASAKTHAGPVSSVLLHPCGELLASTGADKSYVVYDISTLKSLTRVFTDHEITAAQFHPDGHLLGLGGAQGQIAMYMVKDGSCAATFETTIAAPLNSISFSENGTLLSTTNSGSTAVEIRDLRGMNVIKTIEAGSPVGQAVWDYTGQFLAVVAGSGVQVQKYEKKGKSWAEVFAGAVPGTEIAWGAEAKNLAVVGLDGGLVVLA